MKIVEIVLAVLMPPVAVLIKKGLGGQFLLTVGLTLLGHLPGVILLSVGLTLLGQLPAVIYALYVTTHGGRREYA